MLDRPSRRREPRRRRAALGHMCPQCRRPWALTAAQDDAGFLVVCRFCEYERPVAFPRPRPVPTIEAVAE